MHLTHLFTLVAIIYALPLNVRIDSLWRDQSVEGETPEEELRFDMYPNQGGFGDRQQREVDGVGRYGSSRGLEDDTYPYQETP
jgi:hypothetical protein